MSEGGVAPLLLGSPLRGQRIQVVGHAGAGKSTFAVDLSKILQVPVVHLDPIFWSRNLIRTPSEKVGLTLSLPTTLFDAFKAQEIVRQHAKQEAWVIDGNQWVPLKDITYPRATDIICMSSMFSESQSSQLLGIDPPFHVWLYRLLSRAIYKAFMVRGSFYRDFLNFGTSIIVQAFRLRKKKMENWNEMMDKDPRWQRVNNAKSFLESLQRTLTKE
ncbi:hypothetical protein C0995_009085 [Termitomyces sp. Mi166|nr:hypothetical protein C0995_009085 [Termitomyces sp. Mi166\